MLRATISPTPNSSGLSMRTSELSNGLADAVEIHVVLGVNGVGPGQFRLAVQLAQRHAHGEKEAEGLRPQGGAAGGRRLEEGEPQPVLAAPGTGSSGASFDGSPRSSARIPCFMPKSNRRCLRRVASIIRERTSAAMLSHARGPSSRKVGPISRRSAIIVSCSSTKLTVMRLISDSATAYTCSMIHGSGSTET